MKIHEPELLDACVAGISDSAAPADLSSRFVKAIDPAQRDLVISAISTLLRQEQQAGKLSATEIKPTPAPDLGARLMTYTDKSGETTTLFFNITDAAAEVALPIVGVFLTLISGKPISAAVSIAAVCKTLWSKTVTLSNSGDAVALEVLRAIGAIRAARFAGFPEDRIVSAEFPSTKQIGARVRGLSIDQVHDGLKRLQTLQLIECKFWGDQKGDLDHPANRWGERL